MKSSVFVRIDRYRELYDVIRQIRTKLDDAKQVLKKIKDFKKNTLTIYEATLMQPLTPSLLI